MEKQSFVLSVRRHPYHVRSCAQRRKDGSSTARFAGIRATIVIRRTAVDNLLWFLKACLAAPGEVLYARPDRHQPQPLSQEQAQKMLVTVAGVLRSAGRGRKNTRLARLPTRMSGRVRSRPFAAATSSSRAKGAAMRHSFTFGTLPFYATLRAVVRATACNPHCCRFASPMPKLGG
jgi:hypothetical protein